MTNSPKPGPDGPLSSGTKRPPSPGVKVKRPSSVSRKTKALSDVKSFYDKNYISLATGAYKETPFAKSFPLDKLTTQTAGD